MKKKRTRPDRIVLLASLFLFGALLWFSFSVLDGWEKGKKECQEIVTLNPAQIDEQLFTDLGKFPGILSATPLIELDVQLKVDDCIIDTKLTGIDLNRLSMQVQAAEDTALGSELVLLLGADSLKAMTDRNGQTLSEKKQKEILEQFADLDWTVPLGVITGYSNI